MSAEFQNTGLTSRVTRTQQEGFAMTTKRVYPVSSRAAAWLWVLVILCTVLPGGAWGQPEGTVVINNGAAVTNTPFVTLALNAAGPSPVVAMQFSLDGLNFSTFEPFAAARGMTLTAGDGEKRVYVRAKDQLGVESTVFLDSILLDTTAPSELTVNVTTPTNQTAQLVSGTVEAGATLQLSAAPPVTVGPLTVNGSDWSTQVSGLVEGANSVTATATDAAGNTAAQTAVITVDTVAPFLNTDTVLGSRTDHGAISGTAEKGSRIAVNCESASSDVIFFDTPVETKWSAMIGELSEGGNRCTVTATDGAGNATSKEVNVERDEIPPDLEIQVNELVKLNAVLVLSGIVEAGVIPVLTAGTGVTFGPVTVSGSSWSSQVSGLKEGTNIITVIANDRHGNESIKRAIITAVDNNGRFSGRSSVSVEDALKALRIALGLVTPTAEELLRGDVFDDGRIDVSDVVLILMKAVGL